jgi:hypothetical protein
MMSKNRSTSDENPPPSSSSSSLSLSSSSRYGHSSQSLIWHREAKTTLAAAVSIAKAEGNKPICIETRQQDWL